MRRGIKWPLALALVLAATQARAQVATVWECEDGTLLSRDLPIQLGVSRVSFPPNGVFEAAIERSVERWHFEPSALQFQLATGDANVEWGNGDDEIWATDNDDWLSGRDAAFLREFDGCGFEETDIVVDARELWIPESNFGIVPSNHFRYGGPYDVFDATIIHELGHVAGLVHENRDYNIMGDSTLYFHNAGGFLQSYVGPHAAFGASLLYGPDGRAFFDISVHPYKRIGDSSIIQGSSTDEYSIHAFTEVHDFATQEPQPSYPIGLPDPNPERDPRMYERIYQVANGQQILADFTIQNVGSQTAASVAVTRRLSTDRSVDASDRMIGPTTTVGIPPGASDSSRVRVDLPPDLPPGWRWLGLLLVQPGGAAPDANPGNDGAAIWLEVTRTVLSALRLPATPTVVPQMLGTVELSAPPHPGIDVVSLESSNSWTLDVPGSLTVPAGGVTPVFPIDYSPPLCNQTVEITARFDGTTLSETMNVPGSTPAAPLCGPVPPGSWNDWSEGMRRCFEPPENGSFGGRCAPDPGCPECFLGLRGERLRDPVDLFEIGGRITQLIERGATLPGFDQRLRTLQGVLQRHRPGPRLDADLLDRALEVVQQIRTRRALDLAAAGVLIEVASAADLDMRLDVPSLRGRIAGEDQSIDFDGLVRVRGASTRPDEGALLRVDNGTPGRLSGHDPVWPVARFGIEGLGGGTGDSELIFNLSGFAPTGDPLNTRVLQWDGRHYRDVTIRIDWPARRIYAGVESPSGQFIIATSRRESPAEGGGLFGWFRRLCGH